MKHLLLIFLLFLIFIPSVLGATPSIPENFEVNISGTTANISWDESTGTDVVYTWVLVNSSGYENITHTVRNESMVLYTHFNDGTSTDWSLYGNNGTDTKISYVSEDKYGYAAEFNGIDSYINCGNDNVLNITDEITIEGLIKITGGGTGLAHRIVRRGEQYTMGVHNSTRKIGGWVFVDGWKGAWDISTGSINENEFNHIVLVWDNVSVQMYLNGLSDGLFETSGPINGEEGDLRIGYYISNPIKGVINYIRIYNRSLSPLEINANSNIIAESASYDNFTGVISNLSYGEYHIIVNARDNSTYSEWSEVYNFSITQPPELFKASFKIIDQYRSDLVYNAYVNGIYVSDFNITDAYFINTTNDTSITLTASQNYLDISNVNSVRKFITGILGFVLLTAFLLMSFRLGRGR